MPHAQSNKQMIFIGVFVLFYGKQLEWKKFHLQKIVFKKILELLLEWALDELRNQFAKKPETQNFQRHVFL